jgi:hypothetical protein
LGREHQRVEAVFTAVLLKKFQRLTEALRLIGAGSGVFTSGFCASAANAAPKNSATVVDKVKSNLVTPKRFIIDFSFLSSMKCAY